MSGLRLREPGETPLDTGFRWFTAAAALMAGLLFFYILYILLREAWPAIEALGLSFLWGREWIPARDQLGALPMLLGTLASSFIALVIGVPLAIGAAIALTEILPRYIAGPVGVLVELLAAVPSIVFGVWGVTTIVPLIQELRPESSGHSLLAAGIVLAIMILPIITAVTRDMLLAVPRSQREAALALGLTRWEVTWRVVLPNARGGTIAAVILGFGRAWGETMAVIMVIGNKPTAALDLFRPASTIPQLIANEYGETETPLQFPALIELGLILLLVSLALNLAASYVTRRYRRRLGGIA